MKAIKPALWIIAAGAALLGLGLWRGPDFPDAAQARRDFMAEHPTFTIERVIEDEQEVVALSYRVFYRVPGDPALHQEFRRYAYSDGRWRISIAR